MNMYQAQVYYPLKDAKELILQGWCKNAPAKDAYNRAVAPRSKMAIKWSLYGAIDATTKLTSTLEEVEERLNDTLYFEWDTDGYEDWNDSPERTLEDVIRLLDLAMERASR